jgi:hypothetical protein
MLQAQPPDKTGLAGVIRRFVRAAGACDNRAMSTPLRQPEVDDFPPMPWRRRVLVLGLTLATNWVLVTQIAGHPGGGDYVPPPPPEPAPCAPGQTEDCLGGKADVLPPAAPAQPAAPAAAVPLLMPVAPLPPLPASAPR